MTIQRFGVVIAAGVFAWGLAAVGPVPVSAQAQGPRKLDVSFNKGLVTIEAQNVTVRDILIEWGRKGGSRIVNAEKLAGPVLPFVEFKAEPEVVVLRSLLRDVPGYGAAPRLTDVAGASTIEAVFILATRSVPVSSAAGSPMQNNSQAQQLVPQGPPQSQPAPRPVEGSVDSEIPPVRPMQGELPPTTPGAGASNPNLRTGPGGTVTSTIPGVVIPGPTNTTTGGGTTPPPTAGRRGGGGGTVPSV